MAGKLTEPRAITDYNQQLVCFLPVGFTLTDQRWDAIWQRYEDKGQEVVTREDLRALFPEEQVLFDDHWEVTKVERQPS